MDNLSSNTVVNATKWSALTELIAKVINPLTSMILARLLTPEAFGLVAIVSMVVSFAEIFTDAGFQKYIIQHDFTDEKDRKDSINVAFWSNLIMSLVIWLVIVIFRNGIASLIGATGNGFAIAIACVSIPLAAFSSIQMAILKRDFDFKTLFYVRMVGISIPLLITIPLALFVRNFWALIIGTIATNAANVIVLTLFSKWRPLLYYSISKFRDMFSFSIWSVVEAVSIWLTAYIDIFIVGIVLNNYYLGLYNTSISIVGQITALITSITTPILFSALSRLQNEKDEFKRLYLRFQDIVGLLIIPLGVGIYCFRDLITTILLGDQWMEASFFIGIWGLTSSITVVFAHYSSEVYRSLGKPKLSVLAQWLHIIVLWPIVWIFVRHGFQELCIARALVRLQFVLVQLIIMHIVINISPAKMIANILPSLLASLFMGGVGVLLLQQNDTIIWSIITLIICGVLYAIVLLLFKKERDTTIFILNHFIPSLYSKIQKYVYKKTK